jgi:hypothetical protein
MRDRAVFSANAVRRILRKLPPISAVNDGVALEFVSAFRGTTMRPTDDSRRTADQPMFEHDATAAGYELDALHQAKERQDKIHAALDVWISAAIAELASGR